MLCHSILQETSQLKKLSEDGLNKEGCELRLQKEDIEGTSTKSPSTLTSLLRTTNVPSCMQESPLKNKNKTSIDKSCFSENASQTTKLCRFGFDLFKHHGALLTVLENPSDSVDDRASELSEDLMAITTVFTARYYGSRKYTRKAVDV
jgi:hypothetical protein